MPLSWYDDEWDEPLDGDFEPYSYRVDNYSFGPIDFYRDFAPDLDEFVEVFLDEPSQPSDPPEPVSRARVDYSDLSTRGWSHGRHGRKQSRHKGRGRARGRELIRQFKRSGGLIPAYSL